MPAPRLGYPPARTLRHLLRARRDGEASPSRNAGGGGRRGSNLGRNELAAPGRGRRRRNASSSRAASPVFALAVDSTRPRCRQRNKHHWGVNRSRLGPALPPAQRTRSTGARLIQNNRAVPGGGTFTHTPNTRGRTAAVQEPVRPRLFPALLKAAKEAAPVLFLLEKWQFCSSNPCCPAALV